MRLIDADDALDLLKSLGSRDYRRSKGTIAEAEKMLMHEEYTPTIDAEPVVRCGKCKHRGTDDCPMHIKGVPADEDFLKKVDNDFCSYGERKDEVSYERPT